MSDVGLWLLCGAFAAWELIAHFVGRNQGPHTLSNRIWALEQRYGWKARGPVAALVALLFSHLVFQLP